MVHSQPRLACASGTNALVSRIPHSEAAGWCLGLIQEVSVGWGLPLRYPSKLI